MRCFFVFVDLNFDGFRFNFTATVTSCCIRLVVFNRLGCVLCGWVWYCDKNVLQYNIV